MALNSSSSTVQRQRPATTAAGQAQAQAASSPDDRIPKNVLHKYRTFNYRFTLAALPPKSTNNNSAIRQATEKYVILKTTGKKVNELQGGIKAEGFNKTVNGSPGRFDLFMNNVDIETIMAFTQNTNMAMATKIQFDVFEPYSINGFMEALQVAAEAAGNRNYISASYVLKVDFIGYTDDKSGDKVEEVGNLGLRYLVIFIKSVEVKMDEAGTRYTVKAVARNEVGFSDLFALKESIQMSGSTVVEILKSLTNALNQSSAEAAKNEYKVESLHDTFEIVFPTFDPATGVIDFDKVNPKFKEARVRELSSDPSVFTFPSPGTVPSAYESSGTGYSPGSRTGVNAQGQNVTIINPDGSRTNSETGAVTPPPTGIVRPQLQSYRYDPNRTSVMFTKGAKIIEIISSVIRDSDYARKIFQSNGNRIVDQFVEYFHVMVEMDERNDWNQYINRPNYNFKFVVYPYKMHFSRIPLYQKLLTPAEQTRLTQHYIRRKYNYLYTGKNVDVRSFNLVFNHLYFQAYPRSMNNVETTGGQRDVPAVEQRVGSVILPQTGTSPNGQATPVPLAEKGPDNRRGSITGPGGNATRPLLDSFDALVKNMHQAILDNQSMMKLELEILGDPYFLVTGGLGNARPKVLDPTVTDNGEAPYFIHDVMVLVEFRNPEDIDQNGLMRFDKARIPYNGCYRVTKVNSNFRDGVFTQKLQGMRIPGQPLIIEDRAAPQSSAGGFNPFVGDVWLTPGAVASVQA